MSQDTLLVRLLEVSSELADLTETVAALRTQVAVNAEIGTQLKDLLQVLRDQKPPSVEVPITLPATMQADNWYFSFGFDGLGRPATMRAERVKPGSAT